MSWRHRSKLLKVQEHLEKNEYEQADQLLGEIIERESDYMEGRLHRALVRIRMGRFEEALEDAQACVKLRPENGVTHMVEGEVHLRAQDYLRAYECLSTAVKFERDNGRAYYFLARTCMALGKKDEAADYLEVAMQFERDFVAAQLAVEQLAAVSR